MPGNSPAPFTSQWRDSHWLASNYANMAHADRLAYLNDMLGKAHEHHAALSSGDEDKLEEMRLVMSQPPYVCAGWIPQQVAVPPAPAGPSQQQEKEEAAKEGEDKGEESTSGDAFSGAVSASPGTAPENAPKKKKRGGRQVREREEKREGENRQNPRIQYMRLLVEAQRSLSPLSPEETRFVDDNLITTTARAVTSLALEGHFPIEQRAGDNVPVALVNIPQGSTIYVEKPWLSLTSPVSLPDVVSKYTNLSPEDQETYKNLGHNFPQGTLFEAIPDLRHLPNPPSASSHEYAILATWLTHHNPDSHGLVNLTTPNPTSSLYHSLSAHVRRSCLPNTHLVRSFPPGTTTNNTSTSTLTLRATRAIPRGTPLTYSPLEDWPLLPHAHRQAKLSSLPAASASTSTSPNAVCPCALCAPHHPDAPPALRIVAVEAARQAALAAWTAWRELRAGKWQRSDIVSAGGYQLDDGDGKADPGARRREVARKAEAVERALRACADGEGGGGAVVMASMPTPTPTVTPMMAWFALDACTAAYEAGDYVAAEEWARKELSANVVLMGLGYEGLRGVRAKIENIVRMEVKRAEKEVQLRGGEENTCADEGQEIAQE
ncbi:hypothetical protein UCRNP2_6158 [Neofusicoccum parvum UCRNP2]|uniref:SET domain-containing protein n=1 Tax=Botryosphaeria parva (strain UCR-NP2) TaxID=1287680 RepID=R1EH38_BOTPV|nr:hypothetical protein UCRNP2_6158 [Neofusicoccum parvum UCRNP2]